MNTTHTMIQTDSDDTTRTWKCSCGFWCTVETKNAPDYHTPLAQRFNDHLTQTAAVESGATWTDLPAGRWYEIYHRKNWIEGRPGQMVLRANWLGGFRDLTTWPTTAGGFADAAAWCDNHRTEKRTAGGRYEPVTGNDIWRLCTNDTWR